MHSGAISLAHTFEGVCCEYFGTSSDLSLQWFVAVIDSALE